VRERLIRDLIVFNFHGEGQSMRVYFDQVFQAAEFLQYEATEPQLLDRVVMNMHPQVLSQAAFLEKPRSRKDLYRLAGLIEEKFSVLQERGRLGPEVTRGAPNSSGGGGRPETTEANRGAQRGVRLGAGNVDSRVRSGGAVLGETRRRETRSGPGAGGSPDNALEYFS